MNTFEKKIECIRDTDKVGKSLINTINGILAVILTGLAGTIDTEDTDSSRLLKYLSISFGATISGLQLMLAFGIDVLISKYTFGEQEENMVRQMLESNTAGGKIHKGNEIIGKIIYEIKKTKSDMSEEDRLKFSKQIEDLEAAYGPLGSGLNC